MDKNLYDNLNKKYTKNGLKDILKKLGYSVDNNMKKDELIRFVISNDIEIDQYQISKSSFKELLYIAAACATIIGLFFVVYDRCNNSKNQALEETENPDFSNKKSISTSDTHRVIIITPEDNKTPDNDNNETEEDTTEPKDNTDILALSSLKYDEFLIFCAKRNISFNYSGEIEKIHNDIELYKYNGGHLVMVCNNNKIILDSIRIPPPNHTGDLKHSLIIELDQLVSNQIKRNLPYLKQSALKCLE